SPTMGSSPFGMIVPDERVEALPVCFRSYWAEVQVTGVRPQRALQHELDRGRQLTVIVQRQPCDECRRGQWVHDEEPVAAMPQGLVRPLQHLVDVCRGACPHLTDVIGIPHIWMRAVPYETAEGIPHGIVAQGALPRIGGTYSCNDVHCYTLHQSASHVGRLLRAFSSLLQPQVLIFEDR